jgi:hypothetical protein
MLLVAADAQRHIKLTRAGNPAMYDFILGHGLVPTDPRPDPDPETAAQSN